MQRRAEEANKELKEERRKEKRKKSSNFTNTTRLKLVVQFLLTIQLRVLKVYDSDPN